ncbi:YbaB/EbfC family nucleoid-associated protein [Bartonella sp. DGB2]|uniref:YbaB/EbfC family nucleoid-associated protein n=1 Tax=Bartonella sp. DGB2 TaxID=3388426 RepID=UPI00398FB46D
MRDMLSMMKKAKEMQAKMQEMQDAMAQIEVNGAAGGGLVTTKLNGSGHICGIKIDPSLLKPDEGEILEDLIIASHNEAKSKLDQAIAQKTQEMTAGLPIPPGFKLPF